MREASGSPVTYGEAVIIFKLFIWAIVLINHCRYHNVEMQLPGQVNRIHLADELQTWNIKYHCATALVCCCYPEIIMGD